MSAKQEQAAESAAAEVIAKAAGAARKEAPGITKRSSAFYADPAKITRRVGFNPRFDFGDIEALGASIKENGLVNPLRVKRIAANADGDVFELIDGDRRLTAIEALMKKGHEFPEGVPVIIVDKAQTETEDLVQMFIANDGKPFNPMEEAAAYGKMKEAGMTIAAICKAVGRKQVHVVGVLALVAADDDLKEAARKGEIGKTQAKQIAVHARGDTAKQKELVAAAKAAKTKQGREAVKKAIDAARRGKAAKRGQTLKMRALSDSDLSDLGQKLAVHVGKLMQDAKMDLATDLRKWVKEDDKFALAAAFGALEALKAAAGQNVDLEF